MRHQAILETESETESWLLLQHTYNYFLHFSFIFILIIPRLTELRPFKCQCHPVSLWRWPLTCNLEKCYSLRSSFGMYNVERQLRYSHLLTRHCHCNLLSELTSPKDEYRGKLWGQPVTSSMTSSPWKNFFGIIWDDLFICEVKLKLCLIFQNFKNGRHFELATFFYRKLYRKLNIPER